MKKIKVLVKKPNEIVTVQEIDNKDLKDCYRIIGTDYVETYTLSRDYHICCVIDEEGKLKNLQKNFYVPNDAIVGTCIFTSFDQEGNFKSLNDTQIKLIKNYLKGHSI